MANKNVERFIEVYGPVAQQVSKEINVDPNVLLGQWGMESRWGQSEMAKKHYNVGGIKDFSGHGHEAKDNKTGSVDKYVKFEDPEVFADYYADYIKRQFPEVVGSGADVDAFTKALRPGTEGGYAQDKNYGPKLTNAFSLVNARMESAPAKNPYEETFGVGTPSAIEGAGAERDQGEGDQPAIVNKEDAALAGAGVGTLARRAAPRMRFITQPITTILLNVPRPGRWRRGIQSKMTKSPLSCAAVPIGTPSCMPRP